MLEQVGVTDVARKTILANQVYWHNAECINQSRLILSLNVPI